MSRGPYMSRGETRPGRRHRIGLLADELTKNWRGVVATSRAGQETSAAAHPSRSRPSPGDTSGAERLFLRHDDRNAKN